MSAIVAVASCPSYEKAAVQAAFDQALEPFSAILSRIGHGTRVVIKANLVSMLKPQSAATTHPALLSELCRRLCARGAEVVVGDSPGGLYTSAYVNRVYSVAGVKTVQETGARLNQNFAQAKCIYPEAQILKDFVYTSYLDDADMIINFCKLKTHGMMGMSACVKNLFGCIPGTVKPEYHYRFPAHADFADMLIDLNEYFKPTLCIVDAVIGMEGNGPTQGKPRQIGALLISDSPYACDRICAGIIGLDADKLETVLAAKRRNLEPPYTLFGDPSQFTVHDYKLVRTRKELGFTQELPGIAGKAFGFIVRKAMCNVPAPNKKECIGCGKCAEICPAKAIEMNKRLPHILRHQCIRCFCCQEFCPVGAMKVKRPLIARILNR